MKELNFRAWHKKRKRMMQVDKLFMDFSGCVNLCDMILGYEGFPAMKNDEVEFMQYICVDDRNSTPIYDNDIVKDYQTNCAGEVIYYKGSWTIKGFYNPAYDYPSLAFSGGNESLEVIGNIHENPELLEK